MEIKSVSLGEATIAMPVQEVEFLADAINETLNAVHVREFKLRTGITPERAEEIRQQLVNVFGAILAHERSLKSSG